jgi:type I restriction enzyme S subunit
MVVNVGASRDFIARRTKTTAGQTGISGADLRGAPIPLPPFAEQQRIVAEVERRLTVIEELSAAVNANLKRSTGLRRSILQAAFNSTS